MWESVWEKTEQVSKQKCARVIYVIYIWISKERNSWVWAFASLTSIQQATTETGRLPNSINNVIQIKDLQRATGRDFCSVFIQSIFIYISKIIKREKKRMRDLALWHALCQRAIFSHHWLSINCGRLQKWEQGGESAKRERLRERGEIRWPVERWSISPFD